MSVHWRWVWLGGWVTGFAMHWSTQTDNPYRLVVVAGAALGLGPAGIAWADRRAKRRQDARA